ncbi:1-deoxy-D-xylulose-5-phosphate synthase [Tsukamurella tyrosinosolvens]|uniref:1-deoxy-D-xylulose-5-phosphate synthase n=1 Tax=Tsukamurella tyrosinosolvens TaxID=57704 RepID=UPI0007964933|nr:1-deoxy-D-xylulose-5-phosphate synthase [Tsukamurella tyrosinosolvens]KXP05764.1 1-deoxy-D-xylulose-5-phosphate synthase [Tsukamurella tyrosinosolvens]MCA4993630.1 1-deoxy-D-xylulose-5-phosphate synthase [Tsukamurella tyrosinosolvens]QRY83054.1 1-deoxy-D-xylulose-5-phosphate synthase [Tsukamurella tyrosinosolvens]RDB49118.1 1-deoxy-D-xylulose-5-phosphate synthase [Tsukamurella tyrosinosolvens]WEL94885.1 1-deoxy-D-xylulose-5-phosphate synthase [Tsukamurella tyrosinosolvens]
MNLLRTIESPRDLRRLDQDQLTELAAEIRDFLVEKVSATGGHLGPNLGVVELTMAIHRVFDSPTDPVLFDTGHQAYVHKILTGRRDGFDTLRQAGGLSGYPCRAESEHDWVESSHASAALSYADGLAKAFALKGEQRTVVAVVGDGALTGGMCWEALNNIAASDRPVVIVVNDNGRSYAPTIGGLATHLSGLRTQPEYERLLGEARRRLRNLPVLGEPAYSVLHGMKAGIKDMVSPQALFADLGLKYVGPIDGHDELALEAALRRAKDFGGPVVVHALTRKGNGYEHAENHEADQMHGIGVIDPATGLPVGGAGGARDWTSVFAEELVAHGERRDDVVAITGAMAEPTGVADFGRKFPDRMYDVGIAEQHALTSAAGLALGGMHPVVALYATFLNRAFDQLLMDVALLGQGVTVVLDRSGVTGPDGASHHGMWDLSLAAIVPGLRAAVPRDAARLREEFAEALAVDDAPTLIRYGKGAVPADLEAVRRLPDGADVLVEDASGGGDVLIVAVGAFAHVAVDVAARLRQQGISATVVDPRWVLPVPASIVDLARSHHLVVTLEDNGVAGGIGASVTAALQRAELDVPTRVLGIEQSFLDHASRGEILTDLGLTPSEIAFRITGWVTACAHVTVPVEKAQATPEQVR